MPFNLKESIVFLENMGFYDVVLPFILVFTLIYATLDKTKILGKDSKNYNAMVALAIALMFVAATNLVDALNQYLPILGLILAIFLGLMMILGLFGVKEGGPGQKFFWIIGGGVAIAFGISYLPLFDFFQDFFVSLEKYLGSIIFLVVLGLVIVWIVKGKKEPSSSGES